VIWILISISIICSIWYGFWLYVFYGNNLHKSNNSLKCKMCGNLINDREKAFISIGYCFKCIHNLCEKYSIECEQHNNNYDDCK